MHGLSKGADSRARSERLLRVDEAQTYESAEELVDVFSIVLSSKADSYDEHLELVVVYSVDDPVALSDGTNRSIA
jgi:hypothetical protein